MGELVFIGLGPADLLSFRERNFDARQAHVSRTNTKRI